MQLSMGMPRVAAFAIVTLALTVAACGGTNPTPRPTATPGPVATATPAPATTPATAPSTTVAPVGTPEPAPTATPAVSGQPASSPAAAATISPAGAQACADLAAFGQALGALTSVDVIATGTNALKAAVDGVLTSGQALADSAKTALGPSGQALAASLTALKTAVDGVDDTSRVARAASITSAIAGVSTAFTDIKAKLAVGCPAS